MAQTMAQATLPTSVVQGTNLTPFPIKNEASASGVSWAAIAAGSFVTAALALGLLALGAGAGLSSLSPWSNSGVAPSAVKMGALLWFAVVEIAACGLGGYVAGRLRTKWVDLHTDEVYFRDTAHGFLVWAVAFVVTAGLLGSAVTSMTGAENRTANGQRSESASADANRYFIDSLFRPGQTSGASSVTASVNTANVSDEALRSEIGVIFAHSLHQRELTEDDRNYVAETVAAKTGLTRAESERRVTEVFARDQQATDTARKAVAHGLYWLFVALLLGAFAASFAATFGGRQRDRVRV